MLVTSEPNSGPPSRTPSILDSPTLARVERARLRLEASNNNNCKNNSNSGEGSGESQTTEDSLERNILDTKQSLLAGRIPIASMTGPIKRGLLWQQRDRIFSRWKERYFVLTRDYLHCFKRASGSGADRISDMGQFIFKVKLVDVEKVEWLNRRSYSAIGLSLGREGRVLLRCDQGLEDWFELLEECTLISKERRQALKITQGPRSRASLAAPPSHASLQSSNFGLGSTYSSALDDWLMTRHKSMNSGNPFLFSDSVPDLSALNNENHINNHHNGMSTNHSTPKKIPYSSGTGGTYSTGRYSCGNVYIANNNSNSYASSYYGSPRRIFINSFGNNNIVDEEDENESGVQLRRPMAAAIVANNRQQYRNNNENDNDDREWMYRKPKAPMDNRNSAQTDVDYLANDSGLDTPPSTHRRPSSYRDRTTTTTSPRDSTETTVSSSRGTLLVSPGGSFRAKKANHHVHHHNNPMVVNSSQQHHHQVYNHQQQQNIMNGSSPTNLTNLSGNGLNGSRYSIQERILKIRNEEDRSGSIKSANRLNHNELYDPNQNRYYKMSNGNNGHLSPSLNGNGSAVYRERYQHPALVAIINEAQGLKFRDRSYSDCQQQCPSRRTINNNPSPSPRRAAFLGTPTRV